MISTSLIGSHLLGALYVVVEGVVGHTHVAGASVDAEDPGQREVVDDDPTERKRQRHEL